MKRITCLVGAVLIVILEAAGVTPFVRFHQKQSSSENKSVRLIRIIYGDKKNCISLYPFGVDDVNEPDEEFDVEDTGAKGPYLLRVSDDGKYLAIYSTSKLIILNNKLLKIENELSIDKLGGGLYYYRFRRAEDLLTCEKNSSKGIH